MEKHHLQKESLQSSDDDWIITTLQNLKEKAVMEKDDGIMSRSITDEEVRQTFGQVLMVLMRFLLITHIEMR